MSISKNRLRLTRLANLVFLAFLIKYNYLMLEIFYAPSIPALLLRNLLFIVIYLKFIEPLLIYRKIRQRLFFLLAVFTLFFLSNYWYNSYFGNFIGINDIFSGEGTSQFSMFKVLLLQIIRFRDVFFIFDLVCLGAFGFLDLTQKSFEPIADFTPLQNKLNLSNWTVYLFLVFLLLSQFTVGAVQLRSASPVNLYKTGTPYLASVYGISSVYTIEAYSYFHREADKPAPELNDIPYYSSQQQLSGKKTLPAKTNVILIQIESLDAKIIDYKQQNKLVTPFLNSLKKESMYFDNFYAQKVNGSFDADLSVLTSLYPVNRSYVFRDLDLSKFKSLPSLLKKQGYQTLAFHNNNRDYFNRAAAYPDLGFDRFYSKRDFKEDIYPIPEEEGLGINDYDYFNQAAETIKQAAKQEKPFLAYLISLTSHTPFDFYPESAAEDFPEVNNMLVKNYFKSINFTDQALKNFFAKLNQAGILNNTLIVIYADHESEIKTLEYNSSREFTLWKKVKIPYHIPLFIKYPGLEAGISEREGTTTDITPTILDLLGFKELPEQFVGSSLLLADDEPILFLHETPELLYKDQLFIKELAKLTKVGFVKDREQDVNISEHKLAELQEIIDYMRDIFMINEGEIFKEVE